jgi:hypothetical protein
LGLRIFGVLLTAATNLPRAIEVIYVAYSCIDAIIRVITIINCFLEMIFSLTTPYFHRSVLSMPFLLRPPLSVFFASTRVQ